MPIQVSSSMVRMGQGKNWDVDVSQGGIEQREKIDFQTRYCRFIDVSGVYAGLRKSPFAASLYLLQPRLPK